MKMKKRRVRDFLLAGSLILGMMLTGCGMSGQQTEQNGGKEQNKVENEKIGRSAFENCKNLTKVTVNGSKLQTISKNAFKGDKKLKNISLKKVKSLKKVEKAAFKGVSKKVTVKVPKNKKKAYSKLLAKGGIAAGKVRS